jgi:hypothetical protein
MKRAMLFTLLFAATAGAQDSSFSRISFRASALRLPVTGYVSDDWKAGMGAQVEVASNVSSSEIALAVGHVGFDPKTAKPPFTETFFSLAWTAPVLCRGASRLHAGVRLTDVRMNFDDPAFIRPLRVEEETMLSAVARGSFGLGRGFSAVAEASFGFMMLSTRTPMGIVALGIQRDAAMPGWLRGILR